MKAYLLDNLTITCEKTGADKYIKISYPFRYGKYAEIKSDDYTFQFNLNGEIKTIRGQGRGWLDASEWLKRNAGNDWTYFAAGGYTGAYDFTGEYYVPCLPYDSNGIFGHNRFDSPEVASAFAAWRQLRDHLNQLNQLNETEKSGMPSEISDLIGRIRKMSPEVLEKRAHHLHDIIGGRVSVLPPDTRHVEYDVIPLTIADGCLYNCGFCRVKSGNGFRPRHKKDILDQIRQLKDHYGKDIVNYNSVFLGQHDALFAGAQRIEFAATHAFEIFDFKNSALKDPRLFLFGSADSILRAEDSLFKMLNRLPYETFINIGLESADPATFSRIEKPLDKEKVTRAFMRMMDINKKYHRVEVSANFLYGADLPKTHMPSILDLTRNGLDHFYSKGTIYFSPLENIGSVQAVKNRFAEFKTLCRLPVYVYLIQRL